MCVHVFGGKDGEEKNSLKKRLKTKQTMNKQGKMSQDTKMES